MSSTQQIGVSLPNLCLKARAGLDYESSYGKARPNDTILKLQRTTPYYKRNRAHVCSFYIRGECTRGAECPYRHEMPETGELSQQNIKDRYYGVNDPVALKLLSKAGEMPSLEPPDDESIRTLYVGGLDARISEQDLRDNFYSHGEIESVKMVLQRACAFVTYTTREGAEKAAEELSNKLVIKGLRLKLMWGRPQVPKPEGEIYSDVAHSGLLPRAVISQQQNQPPGTSGSQDQQPPPHMEYFNIPPPPQHERMFYPSMDPQRMGAAIPNQEGGSSRSSENRGGGGGSEQRQQGSSGPQYAAYPPPPPPPQNGGQYYQQYYPPPPYGYMPQPPPPSYQQYPPPAYPSTIPPTSTGEQAYQQKPPPAATPAATAGSSQQ